MKTFKRIDLAVQVALIISFTITILIAGIKALINGFLVIGAWQLLSMVVHFLNKWHGSKGGRRYNFQLVILSLALLVCLMPVFPVLFIVLYFAVFIIPILVICYAWICFMEVFHYVKRPLELI